MKIERIYHFIFSVILMETMDKTEWSPMADNMAPLPKLTMIRPELTRRITFCRLLNIS